MTYHSYFSQKAFVCCDKKCVLNYYLAVGHL